MIEWRDEAFVLAARPHGEAAAVVQLLTRHHGRHAGLVPGGQGQRLSPVVQPGNEVVAKWRARLPEQLGTFTLELVHGNAGRFLQDPARLEALASAAAVAEAILPEREAQPGTYEGFAALLAALPEAAWAEAYVQWELLMLAAVGFGLDLERCAAGGDKDQLAYVSPRSGRAVSLAAGEPYRDRLLPLPGFLSGRGGGGPVEVALGLRLTGYFLEKHIFHPQERPLPSARQRLAQRFSDLCERDTSA